MHETSVIANVFIDWSLRSNTRDIEFMPLSSIALQKLLYIANAMHLYERGEWLVTEAPVVGKYGPVFQSLYPVMLQYGQDNISEKITTQIYLSTTNIIPFRRADFSKYQINLLKDVIYLYSKCEFDHSRLTNLVGGNHKQWSHLSQQAGGENATLDKRLIIAHHTELLSSMNCDSTLIIPAIKETCSNTRQTG